MKAIVHDRYGPVDALSLRDVEAPVAKEDEVLVRVRATSVHPDVWHVVTGMPYVLRLMGAGVRRPKQRVPGTDVAGEVESVGPGVTRFRPGDQVFGETVRGFQWRDGGAFAEYVSVPQDVLAPKPAHVTFEQAAAATNAGLIALLNLPAGTLQPGQDVLVNGAAGGVGSTVVQLAKAHGATVNGVDATAKLEFVSTLGADRVIDYTREDFTASNEHYDVIVDIPGNRPFSDCRRVLRADGTYVLIGHDRFGSAGRRWVGSLPRFLRLMALSVFVRQLPNPRSTPRKQDLMGILTNLLETGKLIPVIDRTYPLSQVPEALRYLMSGEAKGRVVITV